MCEVMGRPHTVHLESILMRSTPPKSNGWIPNLLFVPNDRYQGSMERSKLDLWLFLGYFRCVPVREEFLIFCSDTKCNMVFMTPANKARGGCFACMFACFLHYVMEVVPYASNTAC